ncbi:MAG TPA: DUF6531 domain-containing protein, partial [Geothermobacteraceae bacterium]|nr:DUF6531 domain-containing protein [Geothermobacteraceae bacterium]
MRNLILLLFMVLLPVCSYSKEYSYCEEDESTYANIPPFRGLRWQYSAPIWATASDPSADLGLEWRDISTAFKYIEEGNTITRITALFTNANIDGLIESTNTIYNGYLEALWEPLNCENITPCQWILNYYENVECFYYQVEESVPAPSIIYFKIKDDKYVFNHKTSYVWVNLLLDWPDRYNHSEAYGLKYYLDEDLIRSSPGPGFDYWTLKIKDRLSPKIYTLKVDVWWLYETNVVSTKSFQIEILGDCPKITNFTGSNAIIDPYSGGSVSFTYSVDKTFDSADITINGESIETTWDGKLNGKLVEPGTYSALLTVKKGDCTVTASTPVKVEGFVGCPLLVTVGSSANIASGSLTDSLSLFSIPGSSPNMAFALNYNSLDAINNSLGIGWSHSFDIFLTRNASGEVTLHEGNGRRRLYTPSGNGYASQSGDHSTLAKNLDGTFLLTRKNGMEYLFTSQGKITAVIDRSGNILTFVYSDGLLSKVNDSVGHSIIFSYDGHGNLVSLADSAGNVYSFTVSGDTLTDVIFPGGATWNYSYDEQAFLTAKIDPLGNLTTYDYDDLHRLVGSIDPEGQVRSLEYPVTEESERTTTFTEKDGGQWHYTYDTNAGDLLTKTDPQGNVTQYSYDNQHNLLSKTEPGLGTSYYGYDSNGNRVSVTDADGNVTEYTYNDYGQMTSVTNPSHKTTTYTYDTHGNLTKVTDPAGISSTYAYDSQGRLTSSTNATGQSTTLAYDEQGNVASVTGVNGATTFFTYDVNGNHLSMTDALGNVTRYEYDVMGRLEKVTDARGNATKYEYDANGNRTSVTDANGKKTIFDYNFEHQMTSMTDAMGYTTHFTYGGSAGCSSCGGGVDKLTSLTDAKGQSTLFQYNALGKLMTQTDPLGHQTNYGYDAAGH